MPLNSYYWISNNNKHYTSHKWRSERISDIYDCCFNLKKRMWKFNFFSNILFQFISNTVLLPVSATPVRATNPVRATIFSSWTTVSWGPHFFPSIVLRKLYAIEKFKHYLVVVVSSTVIFVSMYSNIWFLLNILLTHPKTWFYIRMHEKLITIY